MRIKSKNKIFKINKIVVTVLFIYVLSLSLGYAYFSESLTINGVASTLEYYDGTALPTSPMVYSTSDNTFHLPEDLPTGSSYKYYTQNTTKNGLNFSEESWNGDTYTLHITKSFLISSGSSSIYYSISFVNPTVLPMTNGKVTTEVTENTGGMLKNASTTISTTELQPGESCVVTMDFETNITWRHHTETAKATVSFDLQGKTRYLYFIITYTT